MEIEKGKFVQFQIEALTIRYFNKFFNELEIELKTYFTNNILSVSSEKRELLYFALSGIKSNQITFEADNASISLEKVKYKKDETFSVFTANQIIKLQKKYNLLTKLNFTIQSYNSKTTVYPFTDCFLKLISMRNKLAHEMTHLAFRDSDIIEIVSNNFICEQSDKWFYTLDTTVMSDESKSIFSNLLFMENMLSELRKRVNEKNETVDS